MNDGRPARQRRRGITLCLSVLCLLLTTPAFVMTMNVSGTWSSGLSVPLRAGMTFYSAQSPSLLFDKQYEILITCQAGARALSQRWSLARNLFSTPFLSGVSEARVGNAFRIRIPTATLRPGFYDLRVRLNTGDEADTTASCTFGYQVEKMPVTDWRPADFDAFWQQAKATLAQVPVQAMVDSPVQTFTGKEIDEYNRTKACLPGDYDPLGHRYETVEAFKVSFASVNGLRIHAWVAKPKGKGPFPAMLVLPGAGFAARPMPLEHARHGYLAMDIQIHGQDVDQGTYERLPGYSDNDQVYEPKESYYFYHVILSCLQAVNYLAARPDVDPTRIVAVGGSQGGHLTLVVAGLDGRIAAAVAAIPFAMNQPYLNWAHNPTGPNHDGMDRDDCPPMPDTPRTRCLAYYDPMNLAPQIHCPVMMYAGLIDRIAPPSGSYGSFHLLATTDKQYVAIPGIGHDWSAEFDRRAWTWLERELAAKTNKP